MRNKLVWMIFVIFLSCSTSEMGGVGVNVGNPNGTIPTSSLVPSFSTTFPEETLGEADTTFSSSTLTKGAVKSTTTVRATVTSTIQFWDLLVRDGFIANARGYRLNIEDVMQSLAAKFADAGITEAATTVQTVSLDARILTQTSVAWQVSVALDATDTSFIRINFTNTSTGAVQATYVFQVVDNQVTKGLFAYVNPTLITALPEPGVRMMGMAFDLTNPLKQLFALRADTEYPGNGRYFGFNIHEQCSETVCTLDYRDLIYEGEARDYFTRFRMTWDDTDHSVCVTSLTPIDDIGVTETTYGFTGPDTPDEGNVTTGCTVETPSWGDHTYQLSYLPLRYTDTDPVGGTADQYADNLNNSGTIDTNFPPTLIDTWLDATDFE